MTERRLVRSPDQAGEDKRVRDAWMGETCRSVRQTLGQSLRLVEEASISSAGALRAILRWSARDMVVVSGVKEP